MYQQQVLGLRHLDAQRSRGVAAFGGRSTDATSSHPLPSRQRTVNAMREGVLSLTCPHCSAIFASTIQMDPKTFEAINVKDMLEKCPDCHRASRLQKVDYFFRPI